MGELLTVATFNFEDGGWARPHCDYRNLHLLGEVVAQVPDVDVLFVQEGRGYDASGQRLRFEAEDVLAPMGLDRSFLTRSDRGVLHELVFVRSSRVRPDLHYMHELPDVFHDQIGFVHVRAPGLVEPLKIKSVQWAHWNGDVRLDAALKLTKHAAPDEAVIIGGDFNCLWPDCPDHQEFEPDWWALPPHKRLHKTLPPGLRPPGVYVSDRRALTVLAEAGFVSAGCVADDLTVTVNDHADRGQGARIDHLAVSPSLAPAIIPDSYRVWVNPLGRRASDHRLVSVALRLGAGAE